MELDWVVPAASQNEATKRGANSVHYLIPELCKPLPSVVFKHGQALTSVANQFLVG